MLHLYVQQQGCYSAAVHAYGLLHVMHEQVHGEVHSQGLSHVQNTYQGPHSHSGTMSVLQS